VSGAAALGVLVPALASLLYACRAKVMARGASRQAQAAINLSDEAGQSAQSAHARLDALSAPPAPPAGVSPPAGQSST
jgi:hypothetical protein